MPTDVASASVIIDSTVNSQNSLNQHSVTEPTSKQALNVYNQTIYAHAQNINHISGNSFEVHGHNTAHTKSPQRGTQRVAHNSKKSPIHGKSGIAHQPLNFFNQKKPGFVGSSMANANQTYHAANNSEFIKAAKISNRLGNDPGATQTNFRQ